MNTHQHMICVKNLARLIKSMANLPFPAYGSIYFANASIDPKLKVPLGDFCIGPHCGRDYWDCTAGEKRYYLQKKPNRGPCEFTLSFLCSERALFCYINLTVDFTRVGSCSVLFGLT